MKRNSNVACFSVLLAVLLATAFSAGAQGKKLPPFSMIQPNGNVFRATDLPMGKPILLIYFSPECEHCEKMMKTFFEDPKKFQKASVAMITFLPVDKVARFINQYGVFKFPNIYAGTEGNSFFIRNYYRVSSIPFAALYTKEGNFVVSYEKDIDLASLAGKLQQLK